MSIIREQSKEAVLFTNEQVIKLKYSKILPGSLKMYRITRQKEEQENMTVKVFSTYEPLECIESIDYEVNTDLGTIKRTVHSKLPNWAKHPMFGLEKFNHIEFPDYSNEDYTLYVDYEYEESETNTIRDDNKSQVNTRLYSIINRLKAKQTLQYAIIGDSISTGAEASNAEHAFFSLFANWLEQQFDINVNIVNKAIGGETSSEGVSRIIGDIVPLQPDIVTIGYGMNDQNLFDSGLAVPVEQFKSNIKTMAKIILEQTKAVPLIIAGCSPNPKWIHASGKDGFYAQAIREVGFELEIPVVDVHALWCKEIEAGKAAESLLLNNINHPNNYGHRIYFDAFKQLF